MCVYMYIYIYIILQWNGVLSSCRLAFPNLMRIRGFLNKNSPIRQSGGWTENRLPRISELIDTRLGSWYPLVMTNSLLLKPWPF